MQPCCPGGPLPPISGGAARKAENLCLGRQNADAPGTPERARALLLPGALLVAVGPKLLAALVLVDF